jgi:uncharacterized protein YmfQ (DUF2313 family)
MSVPIFSADDYAAAMANLLPRGRAWPRDPDTNLMRLMGALAPTYQRNGATAAALVADIFPRTTTALIPEWEETLGLPDPCSPLNPTTEQRRAAILAKFIASGGQSAPYFISVAAALGYTITVTNYSPQTWAIGAGQTTVSYFAVGQSTVGDPLASWGNAILECRLKQIKPAHTILLFQYGISTTMPFNQLDWPNPRAAQRLSFDLMRNFLSH